MDDQQLVFQNLKRIKDYYIETAIESLDPGTDLIWTNFEEEYRLLQSMINTEGKLAYRKVLNEILRGVIFSVLVMIDGGDDLANNLMIDIVERETKETLNPNKALHEEFFDYLGDIDG